MRIFLSCVSAVLFTWMGLSKVVQDRMAIFLQSLGSILVLSSHLFGCWWKTEQSVTTDKCCKLCKPAVRRVTHHRWRPQNNISDLELGLETALETEFPATTRKHGCYFHFTQALWRRVQNLELSIPYRQDNALKVVIRKIMALGYLPVAFVQMNFNALIAHRRTRRVIRQYPAVEYVFDYVNITYIQPGAQFPPRIWNVFNRDMDQRTNNHVECGSTYFRATNLSFLSVCFSLSLFCAHAKGTYLFFGKKIEKKGSEENPADEHSDGDEYY